MARVYNIAEKIHEEPAFVTIADGVSLKINCGYKTITAITAIMSEENGSELEKCNKAFELAFGKDGLKEINKLDLSINSCITLVNVIMAAANNITLEEYEARFQKTE